MDTSPVGFAMVPPRLRIIADCLLLWQVSRRYQIGSDYCEDLLVPIERDGESVKEPDLPQESKALFDYKPIIVMQKTSIDSVWFDFAERQTNRDFMEVELSRTSGSVEVGV